MKILIILAITITFCNPLAAQDSCYIKDTDQFNGIVTWRLRNHIQLSKNTEFWAVTGGAGAYKNCFNIGFTSKDILGVDQTSTIMLLFEDQQTLSLGQFGAYNLKGEFYSCISDMGIGGGKKKLKSLFTKKLKAIRLIGITTSTDINISPETADQIMSSLNCLYTAWKN
jgi:hypothetical protein